MTILITGCKGFIGSNSARYFQSKGFTVLGCDILEAENEPYSYYKITNFENDIKEILHNQSIEVCLFASGAADVRSSFVDTQKDFIMNVYNLEIILDAARETNKKIKFINTSSAAVYGNPTKLPIQEDFELNPISPYGYHKLMSEKLCREYSSIYGMPTINLRIFSVYGEGQKKMLFYDLFKKAEMAGNIELFGTGNESRDFIYIDDLLEAVSLIINNAKFEGESINVANGEEVFIKDAVKIFYGILNPEIKYRFTKKEKIGDPVNWKAGINKIKSYGFSPKYNLSDGLEKYIRWAKLFNF
jgi:UDP-glucose 4-epimerase